MLTLFCVIFSLVPPSSSANLDPDNTGPPFYAWGTVRDYYTGENLFIFEISVTGKWWVREIRSNDNYILSCSLKNLKQEPLENISFFIGLLNENENLVWDHEFEVSKLENIYDNDVTISSLPPGGYKFVLGLGGYYPTAIEQPLLIVDPPLPYVEEWTRQISLGLNDALFEESITVNNASTNPITGIEFGYNLTDNIMPFVWIDPSTPHKSTEINTTEGMANIKIMLDEVIEAGESKTIVLKYRISNFIHYEQEKYPFDEKSIYTLLPTPRKLILENQEEVNISRIEQFSQTAILPKGLQVGDMPSIEGGNAIIYYSVVHDVYELKFDGLIRIPSSDIRIPNSDLWEPVTISLSTANIDDIKNLPIKEERAPLPKIVFVIFIFYAASVIIFSFFARIIYKKVRKVNDIFSYYLRHFGLLFIFYIGSSLIMPRPNALTIFELAIFVYAILFIWLGVCEGILSKKNTKNSFSDHRLGKARTTCQNQISL